MRNQVVKTVGLASGLLMVAAVAHLTTLQFVSSQADSKVAADTTGDSTVVVVAGGPTKPPYPSERSELILAFVGLSTCGYSVPDDVREVVHAAAASARDEAERREIGLAILGIALDESPELGIAYLEEIGGFDEMLAGQGWPQVGAGAVLRNELAASLTTPQIIVAERPKVTTDERASSSVRDRVVLRYRLSGHSALRAWARDGARIPAAVERQPIVIEGQ